MKTRDIRDLIHFSDDDARRAYWTEQMEAAYAFMQVMLRAPVAECGEGMTPLRQAAEEAGVEVAGDLLELPDHVGLELGCMGTLCDAEARALANGDGQAAQRARSLQRRLMDEHLLQWAPSLCARVRENAPGAFYRGIAVLTEAFLRHEREELGPCR